MITRIMTTITTSALSMSAVHSQSDTSVVNALTDFKIKNGSNWAVRINEKTGIPASLHFGTTKPRKGTPDEIAKEFLKENRLLF